jgi:hypothetical protein
MPAGRSLPKRRQSALQMMSGQIWFMKVAGLS